MMPMPRALLIGLLLVAPAAALAGCTGSAAHGYETHDVRDWKQLYESTPGAFLLDVRTPQEYVQGHLANATLIPVDAVRANADRLPEDKTTPIFVYCRSGNRSATASATLADLGYTNVHNMAGGILDWQAAGYPVTTA